MTSENAPRPAPGALGLRAVGALKLASGLLLAAAGFGIFRGVHRNLGVDLERLVLHLHLDPENRLVHDAVARVAGLDRSHLRAIGAGTFFYAALEGLEGTGLILRKRWAEYLTVFATGALLPLELYEIAHKPTAVRFAVLVANLVILAYVVWKIRQRPRAS